MDFTLYRFSFVFIIIISGLQIHAQEICDNGMDDTGNGLVDFNDPECNCSGISSFLTNSIIPNPSFETRSCCPNTVTDVPPGWGDMDCLVNWTQGSSGAALDYINQCGLMASDWLNPPLPFPDGEGCVGFVANLQNVNFQEYVAACLNRPMQADTSYTLNFNLGFGIPANLNPSYNLDTVYSADSVELAIFGNPTCDPDQLPYPGIGCPTNATGSNWVLINTITVRGRGEWVETAFEFTPTDTYRAIAIGASCGIKDLGEAAEYYFIDNLILSESRNFELNAPLKSGSECEGAVRLTSPVVMAGIDYQWYLDGVALPGETSEELVLTGNNLAGDYQVRLSQGVDCEISMPITLINNPDLDAEIRGDLQVCPGDSTSLRISESFENYLWSSGSTDSILQIGESGNYSVTVTDINGCTLELTEVVTIADSIDVQETIIHATGTNDNGSISLSPLGGFPPYSFNWSTGESGDRISGLSEGTYTVTVTDDQNCEAEFTFSIRFEPDRFLVRTESNPITCHEADDGSIRLLPEGGRRPYTVEWDDGSTAWDRMNLQPGTYEVTVSDSDGEEEILEFNLIEPAPLSLETTIHNPSCKGFLDGEIEMNVSGGRSEYLIRVNGNDLSHSSLSNLSAGTYAIEVRDQSNCLVTREVVLEEPDLLTVRYDSYSPTCFGYTDGRIEIINIDGGTGPYSASLNDSSIDISGARQLESGAYTLSVLDQNSCLWSDDIKLDAPEQIEVQVSANEESIIRGQEVRLEARAFPSNIEADEMSWYSDTYNPQLTCIECFTSMARPKSSTTFSFQYWVADCLFTDEVKIQVRDQDIFVPNIFTPNGDGNNDVFQFYANDESGLLIKEINIFNRWGQNVHQVRNMGRGEYRGWNGQFRGSDAPEGVYIYHILLEDGRGEAQQITGDLSLLR